MDNLKLYYNTINERMQKILEEERENIETASEVISESLKNEDNLATYFWHWRTLYRCLRLKCFFELEVWHKLIRFSFPEFVWKMAAEKQSSKEFQEFHK